MEEIKDYRSESDEHTSHLYISALKEKVSLPGCRVERVLAVPDLGYLCFTTRDTPYEETLYIVLVDTVGNIVDQVELYRPYTPGLLKDISIVDENTIRFEFWEGIVHQLEIDKRKKVKFSRLLPQGGCHYTKKLSPGYLIISK